jgi:uncharacterized membrane protein (UPF0127 family)
VLLRVFNQTKNSLLCSVCKVAQTDQERVKGLLDRTSMQAGEGLLILKCDSVHTVGMKFPIDVLYLGNDGIVLARVLGLQPGFTKAKYAGQSASQPHFQRANSVLELPSGGALSTQVGDRLTFQRI